MQYKRLEPICFVVGVAAIYVLGACVAPPQSQEHREVNITFSLINSDIPLYYDMVDKAAKDGVEIDAQYLYANYISKGSEGLHEYYLQVARAKSHEERIEKYWQLFQPHMTFLEDNREVIRQHQNLFAQEDLDRIAMQLAKFLDHDYALTFYFTINDDRWEAGSENSIVVNLASIYSDEIDYTHYPFLSSVSVLHKKEDILYWLTHQIIHKLRFIYRTEGHVKDGFADDIGDYILDEGGGNFFAELLLQGSHTLSKAERAKEYYRDNPRVMEELLAAKDEGVWDRELVYRWFYNTPRVPEGVPPDMGYFLGSVIVWDYYNKAEDKKKAFLDIVQYWRADNKDRILNSFIARHPYSGKTRTAPLSALEAKRA